jgi:hypothetical protein
MMMKRLILALMALCFASAAQAFPQPPDVPAYVAVTPQYKTDSTANVTIDPAVTPPPAYSYELTNIPIPSNTGRVVTNSAQGPGSPYCTVISDGGTCSEYKFRTSLDQTYMLPDDPVRNYGQPGTSHLHCFAGAGSANANSTYKSLRQHAIDSAAAGADANGTGYWRPCTVVLNPYGDGLDYAVHDDFWTVYYVGTIGKKTTHYPVGLRFVFGYDMDATGTTTQFAWLQTILDAANTAQGSTRYTLKNPSGVYQNQVSYVCAGATPTTARVLKNSDGSDPYSGTCASGANFTYQIDGPKCWDGVNLWSPGGYKHMIPGVYDTVVSDWTCPYNYYMVPALRIEFTMTQYGWTDRQRWDLSSDIAYRTAHSLTSTTLPPGTTFHTDWEYGWDSAIFLQGLRNCAGVDGVQGHECNSGYFSSTQNLVLDTPSGTGAGGRLPQVTLTSIAHVNQTDPGWMLIPPSWSGALTNMQMKH